MIEQAREQRKDNFESIYTPEETAKIYDRYLALAGPKLMATLIEANNVLTIGGMRAQTEFWVEEPIADAKARIDALNSLVKDTSVLFHYMEPEIGPDGTLAAMVGIYNLKKFEEISRQPPVDAMVPYAGSSGQAGLKEWYELNEKILAREITTGAIHGVSDPQHADTLLTGFVKGYPWIACIDAATFPSGYGNREDELGIAVVKIPEVRLYGGPLPEFDVKQEHLSDPDVVHTRQAWSRFLREFYATRSHKKMQANPIFLKAREKIDEKD